LSKDLGEEMAMLAAKEHGAGVLNVLPTLWCTQQVIFACLERSLEALGDICNSHLELVGEQKLAEHFGWCCVKAGLTFEDAVQRAELALVPRFRFNDDVWRGVCVRMMPVLFLVFNK
jgi:hypothetical protein